MKGEIALKRALEREMSANQLFERAAGSVGSRFHPPTFSPCCFCLFLKNHEIYNFECSATAPRGFLRIFGYDLQAIKCSIPVPLESRPRWFWWMESGNADHPPKLPNSLAPFKYMKYLQKLRKMFYNIPIEQ